PDFEDVVAESGLELVEEPTAVTGSFTQRVAGPMVGLLGESGVDKPKLEDQPQGLHAVSPTYILALGVGAPVIADGNLVDPGSPLGQTGGDLGLDPEAVRREAQVLEDVAPDRLVAGLH